MKKLTIVLIVLGFTVNAYSQSTTPDTLPVAIKNEIAGKFSEASAMEWTISDSLYSGTFTLDGKRHLIEYTSLGKMRLHRYNLKTNEYPVAITSSIKKNFSAYKIEDIEFIQRDNITTYEAELEGNPDYIVTFDLTGKVLSSKKE